MYVQLNLDFGGRKIKDPILRNALKQLRRKLTNYRIG